MAMYFVVWATDHDGTQSARLAVRDAHRARLRSPGPHPIVVVAGGPTLNESDSAMNGSLLVIEADDIEAVRRFVADDPYQVAGVYENVEIRPWQWGLGAPKQLVGP
ncbi:MAG: YciI family protein [Burkholderiales bacterium]|nr:YciI family protein [Burkholderiales bacterium]MDE2300399.1 YciI family protein [Burkholderiales bacterium]